MAETIRIGGLTLRFLQDRHETGGSLDLFELEVAPDGAMPIAHSHRGWDETVLGQSGRVTFTVAGKPVELAAGETLFIPRGVVHGFANLSGAPASCLCILTPGVLGPQYFREVAALVAAGRPDPAAMRALMQRHGLDPAA